MSNYTKTTNFTAKDSLTSGDPNKIIKGVTYDTEFDNIEAAVATKANKVISGTTNAVLKQSASGDLVDAGYIFSGLSGTTDVSITELDILDGGTITTAELNILDGVTSTAAELNILDGVTSTAAELNILDGVTTDATELNYVDGVTSDIQTQLDAKIVAASTDYVGEAQVDWPNSAGMSQVFCTPNQTTSSSSFVTVMPVKFYVPPGATTLNYYITFLTDNASGTGHCRLNNSGNTGTTVTQTVANTKEVLSGSVSCSGVSGWVTFNCQAYETIGSYGVTFHHVTGTFV